MHIKEEITQKFKIYKTELLLSQHDHGGVYIARVVEDDGINFEVEVNEGAIAFTIRLEKYYLTNGIEEYDIYLKLKDFLETRGVFVYESYIDWEEALSRV